MVASHKAMPERMNARAVSLTIFGHVGTMLVICSMSKVQPNEHEHADGQRDESDELRQVATRLSALGDGHIWSNYSVARSAAIS